MVYTQHFCGKCGSDQIRRNGHRQGHARYQCKVCRYQARFVPAAIAKAAQYAQVDQLLAQVQNATGLHRLMVDSTAVRAHQMAAGAKKNSPS